MNEIENKSGDLELSEIIKILWSKKKLISIMTSTITLFSIIYAFFIATPMFKSTLTLYPADNEQSFNSGLKMMVAQFGIGGGKTSNNYNIPDVAKSRMMMKKVVTNKWNVEEYSDKKINLIEFWEIDDEDAEICQELAIKKIDKLINVRTSDETGLITIEVLTEEPQLSADIVNFIGDEVQRYIIKEQQEQGKKNRVFIEERLTDTKMKLINAEEALKEFKEKNRNINESPEIQLEQARLQRNIAIKQEIYITLEKQKEIAMIEEVKNEPIVNILDIGEKAVKKSEPKRLFIVMITFFIAFFLSITIVIIREHLGNIYKS